MSIAATPNQTTTNPLHLAGAHEPPTEHPHHDTQPQTDPAPKAIPLDLLEDLLDPQRTPIQICHTHNLTLAQLRRLTESAPYRQAIADIQAINAARQTVVHDQLRAQALASARDLIQDAARCEQENRTRTAEPRPFQAPKDIAAQRQQLAAATRHHTANARLLETRRKTINAILKHCTAPPPPAKAQQAPAKPFTQGEFSGTLAPTPEGEST